MKRYKYPRTPHLPFSEGATSDDRILTSDSHFYYFKEVVVSIKMDGENTSIYSDGSYHARSIDSSHRDYHSWLLRFIQEWYYLIPENYHICGEYLYAKHSISYDSLPSYFEAFSVWDEDRCLSWGDTEVILKKLGLYHVPILYVGPYDTNKIIKMAQAVVKDGQEGIVVRNQESFLLEDFDKNVAKFVRPNHVQTDKHWSQGVIERNGLCNGVVKAWEKEG